MSTRRGRQHPTLQTAEAALEQIAARGQRADPRSFALWYNFAAGESGLLIEAVNKKLARAGTLTPQEIEALHAAHISPAGVPEVDKLGAQIADEILQVVAMIEAAEGSASNYSANLADVSVPGQDERSRRRPRSGRRLGGRDQADGGCQRQAAGSVAGDARGDCVAAPGDRHHPQ
jgi:hypothetical protein